MPRLLHLRQEAPGAQSGSGGVFIAVPTYGPVPAPVVYSLLSAQAALREAGIRSEFGILAGHCHVDDARNELIAEFLRGDCQEIVFIDADIQFRASDLIRLLSHDADVVAGAYRKKQQREEYPCRPLPGIGVNGRGLIEVEGAPGGFLRIRRLPLARMAAAAASYEITTEGGERRTISTIFERLVDGRQRFSGDYGFCRKWRALGGRVFVDPTFRFAHLGESSWTGCYLAHLNRASGDTLTGLLEIMAGTETPETFEQLYDEWDNDGFSATPEFLIAAVLMAREAAKPILETGSGLTTLCMAAANPGITVHALEHSGKWAERVTAAAKRHGIGNIILHRSDLRDYPGGRWYDTSALPDAGWGFIVCDGPPRQEGKRGVLFEQVQINGETVLMDDADDPAQLAVLRHWSSENGRRTVTMGRQRLFAASLKDRQC